MMGLTTGRNNERQSLARKRGSDEAGQALLELALLLPILCLLVVGIADLGRAASVTIAVNNAATAGVEYGSQNGATASNTTGMQNAAINDTHNNNLPTTISFPSAPTYGCLCDTGAGVSCTYPVPAQATCSGILAACTGQIVECVQVVTQMSYGPMLYFPGVPTSYQANGLAVMRVRH